MYRPLLITDSTQPPSHLPLKKFDVRFTRRDKEASLPSSTPRLESRLSKRVSAANSRHLDIVLRLSQPYESPRVRQKMISSRSQILQSRMSPRKQQIFRSGGSRIKPSSKPVDAIPNNYKEFPRRAVKKNSSPYKYYMFNQSKLQEREQRFASMHLAAEVRELAEELEREMRNKAYSSQQARQRVISYRSRELQRAPQQEELPSWNKFGRTSKEKGWETDGGLVAWNSKLDQGSFDEAFQ